MKDVNDQCQAPTDTLTVELPCQMLERIERYAKESDETIISKKRI